MDGSPLTLSVVVISWNQREFLQRLVAQLLEQDYPRHSYEIIVVDDGSTDGSREWLRSLTENNVRSLFGNANRGRAAARNVGIRAAQGEIVVMIDGDHTVPRDYLSILAKRHAREYCVIVGKSHFADHPDFRALNHYLNEGGASKLPPDARLPGRYFLTRSCSVPRDLLTKVGLFDETFTAWGGEDLDLGLKLEHTDVPIYGESRCLALHHHFRPLDELLEVMYVYGRDSVPILVKRHPQLFEELNLLRSLPNPSNARPNGAVSRLLYRGVMLAPVYHVVRVFANLMRRHHLPRLVFDYLHLRQYTRGYRDHLATHGTHDHHLHSN